MLEIEKKRMKCNFNNLTIVDVNLNLNFDLFSTFIMNFWTERFP